MLLWFGVTQIKFNQVELNWTELNWHSWVFWLFLLFRSYFSSSLSWPQRIWVGWTLCPTLLSLINQQEHVRTVFFFILLLFFLLVCHLLLATSSSASQSGSTSSPQTLKRQQVWTFLCHCVKLKEKASVLTLHRPSAVVTVMHYSAKCLLFKANECKVLQRLRRATDDWEEDEV